MPPENDKARCPMKERAFSWVRISRDRADLHVGERRALTGEATALLIISDLRF